ncbi:hypothetical protein [Chitinophaga eiseniae]|uniref:Outer membrane protein beta-barrel domain-containing protein n=1 Tax=Chitinophaga eiseniae TaxID=634771 RepID=A0A847SHE5_9BACT|nr:hypothetical protein [Chitinophaga eiseniae]NLR79564.1 hypothetical protein [Chitinophaga eiseniae]
MKKAVLLTLACCFSSNILAQHFMHAAGLSCFADNYSGTNSLFTMALTYSPRYVLLTHSSLSMSIGIPVSYGSSGSTGDSRRLPSGYQPASNTPHTKFRNMFDCPVILNLNQGALSSKNCDNRIGFFAGGGFGYHYGPVNIIHTDSNGVAYTDSTSQGSFGPVANLGVRVRIGKHLFTGMELKGAYMKSVDKKGPETYNITLLANFL